MERGVLGGRAHGAHLGHRFALAAQAQVPARQQQHARVRAAARLARFPPSSSSVTHEAARLRVLGVAAPLGAGRRLQELVQRGAEAGGHGLVALGDAEPGLPLGAHLPELLVQLGVAAQRLLQLGVRSTHPPRRGALHGRHDRADVPMPRLLQARPQPLILHVRRIPQHRIKHRWGRRRGT